jgi:hypothetical protein
LPAGIAGKWDVGLIALHFDAAMTSEGLRKNESDESGRDDNEQKNGEDDGFADADDAPVIEKVKFRFLGRLCSYWIHITQKKEGLEITQPPNSNSV